MIKAGFSGNVSHQTDNNHRLNFPNNHLDDHYNHHDDDQYDQLGEEFDETTPDGRQTRALINVEGKSTDDNGHHDHDHHHNDHHDDHHDHHHHGHNHGAGRLDWHYGEKMRCQ